MMLKTQNPKGFFKIASPYAKGEGWSTKKQRESYSEREEVHSTLDFREACVASDKNAQQVISGIEEYIYYGSDTAVHKSRQIYDLVLLAVVCRLLAT